MFTLAVLSIVIFLNVGPQTISQFLHHFPCTGVCEERNLNSLPSRKVQSHVSNNSALQEYNVPKLHTQTKSDVRKVEFTFSEWTTKDTNTSPTKNRILLVCVKLRHDVP